jgi:hypothetical protein
MVQNFDSSSSEGGGGVSLPLVGRGQGWGCRVTQFPYTVALDKERRTKRQKRPGLRPGLLRITDGQLSRPGSQRIKEALP